MGIDFDRYDPATGKAGAFDFHAIHDPDRKPWGVDSNGRLFTAFGQQWSWGGPGAQDTSFQYLYFLTRGEPIRAALDGVVRRVAVTAHGVTRDGLDYSIGISAVANSIWVVQYDHLLDPQVKEGDTVTAGQIIAYSRGDYMLEIDLTYASHTAGRAYCFADFFEPAARAVWAERITHLMNDWEEYVGDTTIYNQAGMVFPGCIIKEIALR